MRGIDLAWRQALLEIRVRFGRHLATASGIALAIALFSGVRYSSLTASGDDTKLRWLAFLSLIMCLVGVANATLMSVTERYKEIGTLKCLGARSGFIVTIFIFEALALGFIASLSGAVVGVGFVLVTRLFTGDAVSGSAFVDAVGMGVLTGLGVSLLAAAGPALHASRLPAAGALRAEV